MLRLAFLALLLLGVGAVAAGRLLQPPPPEAPPLPTVGPRVAGVAGPGEMAVELDEATLAAQLNGMLAGRALGDTPLGPAAARDLSVQVRNGEIVASGTAQAGSASLPVSLTFTVEARAGRLLVGVRDARLGGIPLPEAARRPIEQSVQGPVDQLLADQRFHIRSATVQPGRLVLVAARP
ncbi:MAG: hypothetical protein HY690_14885 [Chloroflexi bacterium]|nr:hypothetical protein [Chloroflexota bacterium]